MIVFPESFILVFLYWRQGYNDRSEDWFNVHVMLQDQTVVVGSRTVNALLHIDCEGTLYGCHRKVVPTIKNAFFQSGER